MTRFLNWYRRTMIKFADWTLEWAKNSSDVSADEYFEFKQEITKIKEEMNNVRIK